MPKGPGRVGSALWGTTSTAPNPHSDKILAVDPGFVNCGLAWFERGVTLAAGERGWRCLDARRFDPLSALEVIRDWLPRNDNKATLVVEEFRLYPWMMQQQGFSAMGTSEMIGIIRWLHLEVLRGNGHERVGWDFASSAPVLMLQGAILKKRGEAYMRREGIEHVGKNIHARDAELHGWAFVDLIGPRLAERRRKEGRQSKRLQAELAKEE
jgi:hypothetical protein